MTLKTLATATALIVTMAGAASAATFGFSFDNVTGSTAGTVSGVITLADGDGVFAASSVVVIAAPASLGYTLPEEFVSATYSTNLANVNSFVVTGGAITDVNFFRGNNTEGLALSSDFGGGFSFLNVVGSASQFTGVLDETSATLSFTSPTAVPLPAGLPLLVAGLGSLGILSRRRKAA